MTQATDCSEQSKSNKIIEPAAIAAGSLLSINLYVFENGCLALLALLVLHRAKLLASNQSILALGVAPMRVVSRRCRCIVQRLCATDFKRPCLVGRQPHTQPPARMPCVYAQRLCTMQSQQSIHSPSPRGRGLGLGIENKLHFLKTDFFYKQWNPCGYFIRG